MWKFRIPKGKVWVRPFWKRFFARLIGITNDSRIAIEVMYTEGGEVQSHHKLFGISNLSLSFKSAHKDSDRVVARVEDDGTIIFSTYAYRNGSIIQSQRLGEAYLGDLVKLEIIVLGSTNRVAYFFDNISTNEYRNVIVDSREKLSRFQMIHFAHANNGPNNPVSKDTINFEIRRV